MSDLFGGSYAMKALTLWEPFARLVAAGVKSVDTRGWGTPYRGLLAIHAARKWDADVRADIERVCADLTALELRDYQKRMLWGLPWQEGLGCIVAVVELVDSRPMLEAPDRVEEMFGTFGPGRWGWVLRNVRSLAVPVPCRGQRMLWSLPRDTEALVMEQLQGVTTT